MPDVIKRDPSSRLPTGLDIGMVQVGMQVSRRQPYGVPPDASEAEHAAHLWHSSPPALLCSLTDPEHNAAP